MTEGSSTFNNHYSEQCGHLERNVFWRACRDIERLCPTQLFRACIQIDPQAVYTIRRKMRRCPSSGRR